MRGLAHFDLMNWKLVPTEPTDAMLKAADDGDMEYTRRNFGGIPKVMQGPYDHWCAMLEASPSPPLTDAPTKAMELAGMRALRNTHRTVSGEYSREQARACWDAMTRARKP